MADSTAPPSLAQSTVTRTVRLDQDVLDDLEAEADRQDRSVNRLINQAIKELLGRVRTKVTIHGNWVSGSDGTFTITDGTGSGTV